MSAATDPVIAVQSVGGEITAEEDCRTAQPAPTETVVRRHLQAFLDQQGVTAIVADYDDSALFYTEARIYRGKQGIAKFFTGFIASLPENAIERFTLRSLQVDRNIAYITWNVGTDIPLGTDFRRRRRTDRLPDIRDTQGNPPNAPDHLPHLTPEPGVGDTHPPTPSASGNPTQTTN